MGHDAFTLVWFRRVRPLRGDVGHPENALWFCREHVRLTAGKTHLSAVLAMVHIRAALRRSGPGHWPLPGPP
ncbi:hypothetical protein ACN20G_27075 (plasmid) [Streptomyces sp. BI20]|uniref:hypothetical protein n=1 Tax=Streptomyces sp. BI20 TaxID=3403460 RepID=UPI003C77FA33